MEDKGVDAGSRSELLTQRRWGGVRRKRWRTPGTFANRACQDGDHRVYFTASRRLTRLGPGSRSAVTCGPAPNAPASTRSPRTSIC